MKNKATRNIKFNEEYLNYILSKECQRNRRIFKYYYKNKFNFSEIAEFEKISRQRVRIIYMNIIEKYFNYSKNINNKNSILYLKESGKLNTRISNKLISMNINSLDDLNNINFIDLANVKGIGNKSINKLMELCINNNVSFN